MNRILGFVCAAAVLAGAAGCSRNGDIGPSTALHDAIIAGDVKAVDKLIREGADVNEVAQGRTPLHAAVWTDNAEMVVLLVASGADPRALDAQGDTAYEKAQVQDKAQALLAFQYLASPEGQQALAAAR